MSVSRVCVHADRDGDPVAVDLALPSGVPVGELLPDIVGLVDDRVQPGDTARRWRLDRPSGDRLDDSLSLADNGIRHGELLVLCAGHAPAFGPVRRTASHAVITARPEVFHVGEHLSDAACLLAGVLAAVVLARTVGSPGATVSAVAAAVGAVAATAATVATGYATAAGVAAVSLTGATGFLAVPSGPAAPNVFLAATAACTAAVLLQGLSGRATPTLTAVAALSLLTAALTLAAMPTVVVGAGLSTASAALLALGPRLSVLTAGLGAGGSHDDAAARAVTAHAALTGLVAAGAAGAASGLVVLAMAPTAGAATSPGKITFAALIATTLLLRSRTHVDQSRRIALLAGGLASLAVGLHLVLSAHPGVAVSTAGVLVVVGLIALRRPSWGASASRLIDVLEYGALVAVVPAACWVAGGFAVVGGLQP